MGSGAKETAERSIPREQEASAELGRRTHEAMTGIATNLLSTPEFMDALGRAFFRRQVFSRGIHQNEINSVYFPKGDFAYFVDWSSTRFEYGLHGEPERLDVINSTLAITKYDPKESTDGWSKKVASARLTTHFLEGKEGEVVRFTDGSATLGEDYDLESSWETPRLWRSADPTKKSEGTDAIDNLPKVFADLYPTPVKI